MRCCFKTQKNHQNFDQTCQSLQCITQEEVDANYNMDMWVKQCDDGIVSCFEAKVAFYDLDGDDDDDEG